MSHNTRRVPFLPLFTLLGLLLLGTSASAAPRSVQGVVNLNTASADELQVLPGIGPAKARAILDYRKTHPFRTVEELVRIKGIGKKMLVRIKANLTVTGPTTATAGTGSSACACPPAAPSKP